MRAGYWEDWTAQTPTWRKVRRLVMKRFVVLNLLVSALSAVLAWTCLPLGDDRIYYPIVAFLTSALFFPAPAIARRTVKYGRVHSALSGAATPAVLGAIAGLCLREGGDIPFL